MKLVVLYFTLSLWKNLTSETKKLALKVKVSIVTKLESFHWMPSKYPWKRSFGLTRRWNIKYGVSIDPSNPTCHLPNAIKD